MAVEQSTVWCLAKNNNVTFGGCVPRERKALLKFRASVSDPSNTLSSWNINYDDDCCTWQGVECDKATGHVTRLHLQNRDGEIIYDDYYYDNHGYQDYQSPAYSKLQSKTIDSSSLLELKRLSYLDLSWNDFQQSSIPAFLGSMKQLQNLNLSHANFSGIIPQQLGDLSSLHTLDLGCRYMYGSDLLIVDDLTWASKLTSLEYLDLSGVNLSGTKDIIKVFNMLPSIVMLHLSYNNLDNTNIPHTCLNSTLLDNVQHLDLSSNSFKGECPCFLQNMTSLRYLDLSNNHYNSVGPHFFTSNKLISHLHLASNSLKYKSDWISELLRWDKLCHLKSLDLWNNQFYGDISGAFKNTSGCCSHHNLESLELGGNNFEGHLPEEIGELKQLTELNLARNKLSGEIPFSIGQRLLNLERIDVSNNNFSGPIPASLGNLTTLRFLDLSYNQLSGEIPFSIGQHMLNLERIDVYNNSFSGPIPASLGNLITLRVLDLSRNHLSGKIPISIGQLLNMEATAISYNNFSGPIPASLRNLTTLRWLYLGNNQLSGEIPFSIGQLLNLEVTDISDNKLSGPIPASLGNLTSLRELNLEKNQLRGGIPTTLGQLSNLKRLEISNNEFDGHLPKELGDLKHLRWLCVLGSDVNNDVMLELFTFGVG